MDYKSFIELSLSQGVRLRVGEAIRDGFNMTGKNAGAYIGFTIVMFLITMFASFLPFVGGLITGILISPALVVGYALYARKAEVDGRAQFETFFDGFKTNYGQLVIVNLIIQVILLGLSSILLVSIFADMAPLFAEMAESLSDPEYLDELIEEFALSMIANFTENWWLILIYIIVALAIQLMYLLANYFVVFYGFGFWEAMESSRQLISKVILPAFVTLLIAGIIMILGTLITLGFGIIFFYPFSVLVTYAIFKQVAGFASEDISLEDDLSI